MSTSNTADDNKDSERINSLNERSGSRLLSCLCGWKTMMRLVSRAASSVNNQNRATLIFAFVRFALDHRAVADADKLIFTDGCQKFICFSLRVAAVRINKFLHLNHLYHPLRLMVGNSAGLYI